MITYRHKGRTRTLEQARVTSAVLSRAATGPEVLRLTIRTEADGSLDGEADALDFEDGDYVSFHTGGHVFFTGRVKQIARSASAAENSRQYEVRGPWDEFERRTMLGEWRNSLGTTTQLPRSFTILEGQQSTIGSWLQYLVGKVEAAILREDGVLMWARYESPAMFRSERIAPVEPLGVMTYADAIVRAVRWEPDMALYWQHFGPVPDGLTTIPIIHCTRAEFRETWTVRFGHDYSAGTVQQPRGAWESRDVQRTEFAPAGVVLIWGVPVDVEGQPRKMRYVEEKFPTNVMADERDVMVIYQDIDPDETEAPPPAFAEATWRSLQQFRWSGSVMWQGELPLLAIDPGSRLNIIGDGTDAEWHDMLAFIDSVNHDLMQGKTTVHFGPPAALGFDDFRELLRFWRERNAVPKDAVNGQTDGDTESYGFAKSGNTEGMGRIAVFLNVNGSFQPHYIIGKRTGS